MLRPLLPLVLVMAVVSGRGMMRATRVLRVQDNEGAGGGGGGPAPWTDCSSDASRMHVSNVTLANDRPGSELLHVGGALNISMEAWVSERIEADAPVVLSLRRVTRGGWAPVTAYFESGLCGQHVFQVEQYVFHAFGLDCPAPPGVHRWTLLADIPPEAPRGTYASRVSFGAAGDLCFETSGITLGPFLPVM
jgi:hypothetical protein